MSENEWIEIFHNKAGLNYNPCNKLAFKYRGSFEPGTVLMASNIQWPDEKIARPAEEMRCGSCGMPLMASLLTEDGVG